jgi:hypothetical protein
MRLPLLGTQLLVNVFLFACSKGGDLALARLRILNKGAILFVKLTQDTNGGAFVYYAATLTATAGIAGPFAAGSDAGETDCSDGGDGGDGGY